MAIQLFYCDYSPKTKGSTFEGEKLPGAHHGSEGRCVNTEGVPLYVLEISEITLIS
jgi:hypothetical protein